MGIDLSWSNSTTRNHKSDCNVQIVWTFAAKKHGAHATKQGLNHLHKLILVEASVIVFIEDTQQKADLLRFRLSEAGSLRSRARDCQ